MAMRPQFSSLGNLRPKFKVLTNRQGQKFVTAPGLIREYRHRTQIEWEYLEHRKTSDGTQTQVSMLRSAGWLPYMANCNPIWRSPTEFDVARMQNRLRAMS